MERHLAEQAERIVQLAKAGQFDNMPAEQQRLEQIKVAVRADRLASAKKAKATT